MHNPSNSSHIYVHKFNSVRIRWIETRTILYSQIQATVVLYSSTILIETRTILYVQNKNSVRIQFTFLEFKFSSVWYRSFGLPYDTFLSLEIGQGAGSSVAQGGDQRSRKSEGFDGRKIRVDEALATWAAQAAGPTAGQNSSSAALWEFGSSAKSF